MKKKHKRFLRLLKLFKYNGSKKRIFYELKSVFDTQDGDTFIDLCGGSGIMTANLHYSRRIINDLSTELTVIYKALSCDKYADSLAEIMRKLECDEDTFKKALDNLDKHSEWKLDDYDDEELPIVAADSWFVHFFSRSGNQKDKKVIFTDDKLIKWYELVDEEICYYMDTFNGVEVWNMDVCEALDRIRTEIKEDCIIYIDPPYLSAIDSNVKTNKDTYKGNSSKGNCGSDEQMHKDIMELSNSLSKEQYHVIISNYNNELYNKLLETPKYSSWYKNFIKEIDIMCGNGANCLEGRKKAKEFIYTNFRI